MDTSRKPQNSTILLTIFSLIFVMCLAIIPLMGILLNSSIAAMIFAPIVSWITVRPQACNGYGSLMPGTYMTDQSTPIPNGFVITFSAKCRSALTSAPVIGYAVFERTSYWLTETENNSSTLFPNQTFSFGGSQSTGWSKTTGAEASTVFHGLIQDPTVASVELIFADGQTMKSSGINKSFLFINFLLVEPCFLQSIDQNGTVLERFDLAGPPGQQIPGYLSCP